MIITEQNYIGLGFFIKSRRKVLGISKEKFAELMHVPTCLVDQWESENLDNICLEEIKKISLILSYCPLIFLEGVPKLAYLDWDKFINQDYINIEKSSP